jgi:predicted secreted protein
MLTLSLTAAREGVDAQTVQNQLKAALDDALTLAKREAKGSAIEVRTGRFGLFPRYDRNGKMTGWQGSAELLLPAWVRSPASCKPSRWPVPALA